MTRCPHTEQGEVCLDPLSIEPRPWRCAHQPLGFNWFSVGFDPKVGVVCENGGGWRAVDIHGMSMNVSNFGAEPSNIGCSCWFDNIRCWQIPPPFQGCPEVPHPCGFAVKPSLVPSQDVASRSSSEWTDGWNSFLNFFVRTRHTYKSYNDLMSNRFPSNLM